jgi:hypothetical protein
VIAIEIDKGKLKELLEATKKAGKSFPKELAQAINQVSKKTRLDIGRDIRKTVALKKADSEKPIKVMSTATTGKLSATVRLNKTRRLGLNAFGARQDKSGVSYRISKNGGRKRVAGAFQGPRPGVMKVSWRGNAFKRVGKSRLPIVKLRAVSAWGAYAKNDLSGPQVKAIEAELAKQMERRIKLNILRANGLVSK